MITSLFTAAAKTGLNWYNKVRNDKYKKIIILVDNLPGDKGLEITNRFELFRQLHITIPSKKREKLMEMIHEKGITHEISPLGNDVLYGDTLESKESPIMQLADWIARGCYLFKNLQFRIDQRIENTEFEDKMITFTKHLTNKKMLKFVFEGVLDY